MTLFGLTFTPLGPHVKDDPTIPVSPEQRRGPHLGRLLPSQSLSHQVWPFLPSHCLSNLLFPSSHSSLGPGPSSPLLSSVYLQEAVRKVFKPAWVLPLLRTCRGFPSGPGGNSPGSHLAHGAQGCLALAHLSSLILPSSCTILLALKDPPAQSLACWLTSYPDNIIIKAPA